MITLTNSELALFCIAAITLLALNAVFVASEFSLVKLRYTRFGTGKMKEAKQDSSIGALLDDMSSSIKLVRLGMTMFTIGIGFLLVPIALVVAEYLGWGGASRMRIAIFIAFLVSVSVQYVLGEIIPRTMALQYPVQALKAATPVLNIFRFFTAPFAKFLNWVSGAFLRLLRLDPSSDLNLLDVESQIRSLVSEGDELPEVAENILNNALDLGKRVAHDIMIPRNQLKYFDVQDSISENLKMAREVGHTRFPLCKEDLDHCAGIIHIKDLFQSSKDPSEINLTELMRPMLRFDMDTPLEAVLQRFLKEKQHFALLTDEFGGTVGAVTLEDVLEEVVGEIQDEFDRDQEMVLEMEDRVFSVDGLTPLHDLSEMIGVELEAEEVSTFGGYITLVLGRMPRLNETFRLGELEITATNLDKRRVIAGTVRVMGLPEDEVPQALD